MVESPTNRCALEDGSQDASHGVSNHKDKQPINSLSKRLAGEDAEIEEQDGGLGQVDGHFVYDLDCPKSLY